jgi:hypothetical protein
MSQPEEPSERDEVDRAAAAEAAEERETKAPSSLLDSEVEAPINAAVQHPDFEETQGTEGG